MIALLAVVALSCAVSMLAALALSIGFAHQLDATETRARRAERALGLGYTRLYCDRDTDRLLRECDAHVRLRAYHDAGSDRYGRLSFDVSKCLTLARVAVADALEEEAAE